MHSVLHKGTTFEIFMDVKAKINEDYFQQEEDFSEFVFVKTNGDKLQMEHVQAPDYENIISQVFQIASNKKNLK